MKTIKYSSTLTSKIKKYATTVKKGTSTLKVTKQGYLKFTVPSTKTWTFTFSGQTGSTRQYNNGYAYISLPEKNSYTNKTYLNNLKFKTAGGTTSSAYFHTKYYADTKKTTGSFLATRSCKLKLKKGQTVYLYLYFSDKGTIKLNIK